MHIVRTDENQRALRHNLRGTVDLMQRLPLEDVENLIEFMRMHRVGFRYMILVQQHQIVIRRIRHEGQSLTIHE